MTAMRFRFAVLACIAFAACSDSPFEPATNVTRQHAEIPADWDGTIRIGVVTNQSSVTLGSAGDYSIKQKTSGIVFLSGTSGSVTVTLGSPSIVKRRLSLACLGSATGIANLKARAEALGYVVSLQPLTSPLCTRVLVGDFDQSTPQSVLDAFKAKAVSDGLTTTLAGYVNFTVSTVTYRITRGATVLTSSEPLVVTSSTSRVTINNATYRGTGEVRVGSGGLLSGINHLPFEQYLYGVVPRELGPIQYPQIEALKAQAVAARTYGLSGLGKRLTTEGFDLLATTADQVYGGYSAEHPVTNAAVDETRGLAITYNGALIQALYSSTSGGHTADNEESFNSALVPYLRGVPDAERGEALEHVPNVDVFRNHANATSLRNVKESDFGADLPPRLHRWKFEWSAQEISNVISVFAGTDVGKVLAINVTERGPSGRALAIEYVTEAGTFTDTKDRIRSSLKFIRTDKSMGNLPSTLFFIEPTIDHKTKEVDGFVVYGGGFGHGVGMAQTGAVGMAEKGHTFQQILVHYYRGVELVTKY